MNAVAHNISSMFSNRQLGITTKSKAKSAEKLGSGYKINRAADDAAGLSISEKMRRQIRGLTQASNNCQDGVSMCQIADGALAEVDDMLHRITELSVKASNGTNSPSDRKDIQGEIDELVAEIDRISTTTKFNELYLFKGTDKLITNSDGTPAVEGDIPFSAFKITNVNLGNTPYTGGVDNINHLGLKAVVDLPGSGFNGKEYNLIYDIGSTSNSDMQISYNSSGTTVVDKDILSNMTFTGTGGSLTNPADPLYRTFKYENATTGVDLDIKQTIVANESNPENKFYTISFEVKNNSAFNVDVDYMFEADTAYNDDDNCETYFVSGNKVGQTVLYDSGYTGSNPNVLKQSAPTSFSIINADEALAFSEKISFVDAPSKFIIGAYSNIEGLDLYQGDYGGLSLGHSTNRMDLAFGAIYDYNLAAGATKSVTMNYGIAKTENDPNLLGNKITRSNNSFEHSNKLDVWLQAGGENTHGFYVEIDEMNSTVIGINDLDVSTINGARSALDKIDGALKKVNENRSKIGAQQNRIEHSIKNLDNVVENTAASESRIRDTDMASEMVKFSKESILQQAGESVLAQANQSPQGVLSLLQ